MPLLGSLLSKVVELRKNLPTINVQRDPYVQQKKCLIKLLKKARFTEFGKTFSFDNVLESKDPCEAFRQQVPIFDYTKIYQDWWSRSLRGESNITWPDAISYYAISSGTS